MTRIPWDLITAIIASGGFWAFLQHIIDTKTKRNSAETEALGALLRHDMWNIYARYRDANEVPKDVQEEMESLWQPYHALGYNHMGDKIHNEIMSKKTKTD